MADDKEQVILKLGRNPALAHAALFGHRHHDETPAFHYEVIQLWHSSERAVEIMAFRGGGKTTIAEEAITVQACFRKFHNGIILGSSYERACERLAAIKHEFETNEFIAELFGDLVGSTWNEGKIVLKNGVVLQAFGRGQSLRGSKHFDRRPDCCFADDLEEQEDVDTPEARAKMLKWFMKVVLPALDPHHRIRLAATPLHPESLAMVLSQHQGWTCRKYPIESIMLDGGRQPTWPARFPLEEIDRTKSSFEELGLLTEFNQEYMCEAEHEADKAFRREMFHVEHQVRTWQAVYGFYDPARSVKTTSATTGWCYFSWINNRLVVWDAGADMWKPDEMINHIFEQEQRFSPVLIGVERDGLEEWLMQPLRHEMARRRVTIPVEPFKAPVGKIQFIKGLQLFFKAREVIFDKPLPVLEQQLLGFPSGRIDAPNALAYALKMRPGAPVYDGFNVTMIAEELSAAPRQPLWLAVNATKGWTTGVLVQSVDGGLHVLADFACEGDPGQVLHQVMADAGLESGRAYRVVAGPSHFTGHDTVGLGAAARRVPVELRRGAPIVAGQAQIQRLMRQMVKGAPALQVSSRARWTLNAFSGGYCRDVLPNGTISDFTKPGVYRVLLEGLESFAGLLGAGFAEVDDQRRYAVDSSGRRFLTARG